MMGFNHWMSKALITRALVLGIPGTALCGEQFLPSANGAGGTSKGGLPICPLCEVIRDMLADDVEAPVDREVTA